MRRATVIFLFAMPAFLLAAQAASIFQTEAGLWLGWLALPFVWQVRNDGRVRWRWAVVAAGLLALVYWMPVRTLLFLAGFAAWLFAVESLHGRAPWRIGLLGLVMSPVFYVAGNVFTFPLRLQLTTWAGSLLHALGTPVEVQGNLLVNTANQARFAVEPACEGVVLLQTAAVLLIFLSAYEARRSGRMIRPGWELALFATGLLLALGANLARIVLLVQFRIGPASPAHDLVGLLGLLFYLVAPMWGLTRLAYGHWGRPDVADSPEQSAGGLSSMLRLPVSGKIIWTNSLLLVFWSAALLNFKQTLPPDLLVRLPREAPGFERRTLPGGVTQYLAPGVLAYVKPIPTFYSSEHHPALCWEGSGYTLTGVREDRLAGQTLYTGTLEGPDGRLGTAWWYDNGAGRTISQWTWRRRHWQGEPAFCIVNVTVPDGSDLGAAVRKVLDARLVR